MSARLVSIALALVCAGSGCSESGTTVPLGGESDHSSSIALSADGSRLYVVNPDADSVSILDAHSGKILHEVPLAASPPAPTTGTLWRYDPAVEPRALAFGPAQATLWVTGHRSGHLYEIDTATGALASEVAVCSEPAGVLAAPDGKTVYVACSQDDMVVGVEVSTKARVATATCDRKPWTLAWSADRSRLYATHLLGPGVSVFAPSPLARSSVWPLADGVEKIADPTSPHGPARGIYDVLPRPGSGETWVAHMMLGIDTPQPTLAFNMTAFPAISLFDGSGTQLARLTVTADPQDGNAFGDVVSSPRALAFSPDGSLAFVADTGSEDVLVVDANQRVEAALVRPLPGHQPEGIVASADGRVYVDERNTSDVAVLTVKSGAYGPDVEVTGRFPRVAHDPMPAELRLGQHIFYSANSDELPLTTDHWVSCAACHVEGRSDAVTWRFAQGPRDTPSNAGGVLQTGFLFRTAARNKVQDYWQTIDIEQGGHFSLTVPALAADLDALEQYVNHAIPYPTPPSTLDAGQVSHGQQLFDSLHCARCHAGSTFTDSGSGNPTLDLAGPVTLHDVGTCITNGPYDDNAVPDEDGHPRGACLFDTPTLRGVSDSAPYLHDGSAATLEDVFRIATHMDPAASQLSDDDLEALVAYLKSL